MSGPDPDFIFVGPGRSASTWLYECLVDHPDVLMTDRKVVNYYDRKYHKGLEWFREAYPERDGEDVVGAVATSYISTPGVVERIHDHVPDATLLFCLRNPMDRAYSHWWHLKQGGSFEYDFGDALDIDTPYITYLLPGMYHLHLERYRERFDDKQLEILFFEEIVADDVAFIADVYGRIGVDPQFVPTQAGERINEAGETGHAAYQRAVRWVARNAPQSIKDGIRPVWQKSRRVFESKEEYEEGMDPAVRAEIEKLYVEDVRRLDSEVNRDLSHWFDYVEL